MRVNDYGRGRGLAWHPHDPSRHAGRRELGEANHADLLRQRAAMATGRWTNEAIPEDASISHLDGGAVHHRKEYRGRKGCRAKDATSASPVAHRHQIDEA